MQHVEDSACSAVAGTMMRKKSTGRDLGQTRRRDSKKRLLKKSCPTVSRACILQSSPAYLQRCNPADFSVRQSS